MEIGWCLEGAAAQERERFENRRWLLHEAASLQALAFHKPRKLPNYKPLKSRRRSGTQDPAEAARVRGALMAMAAPVS